MAYKLKCWLLRLGDALVVAYVKRRFLAEVRSAEGWVLYTKDKALVQVPASHNMRY